MIRQPMLRLRGVGRVTIGVLGVAAALLLAPPAMAQPEVDANNAITAAWTASGGDTGPLGPRTGEVYPVGDGFAQNFAAGRMFFTPDTGAHFMQGAILEKYEASGGPADGDLGFPTIDEGPGRAPESRNSTFSAPDNPVIFWTPATGARIVRGPINAAWDKLGGSSGTLGVPAEDEVYNGSVVSQKFTGGELSYDARTKTFTTVPPELAGQLADLSIPDDPVAAINAARRAAGGPLGPLGAVEGEPYDIGSDGKGQDFANGAIYYSPDTGANVVTGQVLEKYKSVGGPEGDLGFPVSGEEDGGLAPASRKSSFAAEDKPVIFWTPDHGAFIVRGPIVAAWDKLGGATGELGAPVADQTDNGGVLSQQFSGGTISWDSSAGKFSTEPAGLASQLTDVVVPGADAPQATPPTSQAAENNEDAGSKWNKWWLLAVVPLLLLAGLVAFAVMRNRSRAGDDDMFAAPGAVGHDPHRLATEGHDGPDDDGREDALFGDRYAREGLDSLASANPAPTPPQEEEFAPQPLSFWGVPVQPEGTSDVGDDEQAQPHVDPDAVDTTPTRIPTPSDMAGDTPFTDDHPEATSDEYDEPFEDVHAVGEIPDQDADLTADREPLVSPVPARDGLTDTGRHARIDIDEPMPLGTALHMPFDDPNEIPDGYPVKADTKSGLYWTPESADYHEAPVELWFASEEIARTNGFVRGE